MVYKIYFFGLFTAPQTLLQMMMRELRKEYLYLLENLRGFEPGKIGPKDGDDYIGGNFGSSFNLASTCQIYLQRSKI